MKTLSTALAVLLLATAARASPAPPHGPEFESPLTRSHNSLAVLDRAHRCHRIRADIAFTRELYLRKLMIISARRTVPPAWLSMTLDAFPPELDKYGLVKEAVVLTGELQQGYYNLGACPSPRQVRTQVRP